VTDAPPQHDTAPLRERARRFIEHPRVVSAILTVIIMNAVILGLTTADGLMHTRIGWTVHILDEVILGIFVIELLIKLYAYRMAFFRSAWNVFDFFVVGFGLLPSGSGLSTLRGLRVIRALRLLSAIPQMRAVVQALLDALPGMGAVIVMISIVFYVFAVMATLMYGDDFTTWFGTLGRSLYTLFQVMTLESWSMGIVRPVMEVHPMAWTFFVSFIVITSFSVLNLFIGLLVNTMQGAVEEENEAEFERLRNLVKSETDSVELRVAELVEEVRALRAELAQTQQRDRNPGES